jgi:hypothetical protein
MMFFDFLQNCAARNPETRQTRSLPDDLPDGPVFTATEQKIINEGTTAKEAQ